MGDARPGIRFGSKPVMLWPSRTFPLPPRPDICALMSTRPRFAKCSRHAHDANLSTSSAKGGADLAGRLGACAYCRLEI